MVISEGGVDVIIEYLVVFGGKGMKLNVIEEGVVDVLIKVINEEFGVVEILINNVGIICDNLLMRMKDEEWQVIIDINLIVIFLLLKVVLCGMMKKCCGCIVNVGFVVGSLGNVG